MKTALPNIIAGPILRRCTQSEINIWLVTSTSVDINIDLNSSEQQYFSGYKLHEHELTTIQVGKNAFMQLITLTSADSFPLDTQLFYDIEMTSSELSFSTSQLDELNYPDSAKPSFFIKNKINNLLHGSCRKPHYDGADGLLQVDNKIAETLSNAQDRPALLMMSGDQVYCDDVAGPTLNAIEQVIEKLGLYKEAWEDPEGTINNSDDLFSSENRYYHRHQFLPHCTNHNGLISKWVSSRKEIFTSVNAQNHLVSLSEVLAMYFLVWSPSMWEIIDLKNIDNIPAKELGRYQSELKVVEAFAKTLPQVRRALAHIPTYMIFDDHDVTDDWNLTRGWEESAYSNPFSKRIIGNALLAYTLCQGWGNNPERLAPLIDSLKENFSQNYLENHDEIIDQLNDFDDWDYHLETSPKIMVLDTRTQRWQSESKANKPSGLMNWESLSALQQQIIGHKSIILVSAAPIYGVKIIETIQRIFTFFGKPLAVDAENWMAHPGTANVILNIFRHKKTPPHFIILSGDVHYSFVYEVRHRFISSSSKIMQITSSGIKNTFPTTILGILERLNHYLFGRYSPLNFFTKRRSMKIYVRKPSDTKNHTLYNGSGIGYLKLNDQEQCEQIVTLTDCGKTVSYDLEEHKTKS